MKRSTRRVLFTLSLLLCFATALPGFLYAANQITETTKIYLPVTLRNYPWQSPFGFETGNGWISDPTVQSRARELGASWVRFNTVSWRDVQPTRGAAYNWAALAAFEADLISASQTNLSPIVIVDDSPYWATIKATSCSAIRTDRFADFSAFMQQLVTRYSKPPYNVHYWEIGNEIDVDPSLVGTDSVFGCWGDKNDFYYGGRHYGDMLKVVTPVIKSADPIAQVVIGGLLMDSPNAPDHSERFFEGVLRSGAATSFDFVGYHAYGFYTGVLEDYDTKSNPKWAPSGGLVVGKAMFLRNVMAQYGVNKPLFLTETALLCISQTAGSCDFYQPFLDAQADMLVRQLTRAWSLDVKAITWYTLDGPGWNASGLLDGVQNPRPSYLAYQQYISQTLASDPPAPTTAYLGSQVEAYRFTRGITVTDVLWCTSTTVICTVTVPETKLEAAYTRDGALLATVPISGVVDLNIGFSPIYIRRAP